MNVKVSVNQAEMQRFLNAQGSPVQKYLDTVADQVASTLKSELDAHRKTGELQQTVRVSTTSANSSALVPNQTVITKGRLITYGDSRSPQASALEFGARPHLIKARNASNLAFFWIRKNVFVITPSVNHPGNKPYEFMEKSLRRVFRGLSGNLKN